MNDDHISHLVRALDAAVESSPSPDAQQRIALCASLDHAALRLRCLTSRLGSMAEESSYLAFLRRMTRADATTHTVAASA